MAIIPIVDGGPLQESDFTTSFEALRTELNAMTAANIRRRCFGPQHLPGLIAQKTGGANYGREIETYTAVTVNTGFTALMNGTRLQQIQDITTNWQTVATCNGAAGAGFQLPDCHVLFWASFEVDRWDAQQAASGNYALGAITYKVQGSAEDMVDATDYGFVLLDTTCTDSRYGRHHMTIWSDITFAADTLEYVRLRCAKDPAGADWVITTGNLGFVALYWDQ